MLNIMECVLVGSGAKSEFPIEGVEGTLARDTWSDKQTRPLRKRGSAAPEHIRPLVVLYMGVADRLPPPRGEPQVHQVQALLVGGVRLTQQEVLWLHIAVHIPAGLLPIQAVPFHTCRYAIRLQQMPTCS